MSRFWDNHAKTIDLGNFRASDQYLWQPDSYPYEELWRRLMQSGECTRVRSMGEDDAFGARVWRCNEDTVSRDLLDSLFEIRFLEEHLPRFGIKRLLDIGCGYGRLAHRLGQTHPELEVYCTDKVPVSMDACRVYQQHRNGRWRLVWPESIRFDAFDVACNVHSWSECTRGEVAWWVSRLVDAQVPYLFVVPHNPEFSTKDAYSKSIADRDYQGGEGEEFRSVIVSRGYGQVAHERSDVDGRNYYLFRLNGRKEP